jgi:hypothetical protein
MRLDNSFPLAVRSRSSPISAKSLGDGLQVFFVELKYPLNEDFINRIDEK